MFAKEAGAYFKEFYSRKEPQFMGLQEIFAKISRLWSV